MKRLVLCLVLILSLCGCGFLRQTTYVVVEPHDEDYEVSLDSNVITVSSYLSLKNAILNMVEDSVKEGVIRAESYQGNLTVDLDQAVTEVTQMSPLGAFAVEHMTYDYSKIVGYYEIHINTTFRRSLEEIQSVVYVNDLSALRVKLREAMSTYEPILRVRVGDFEPFDLKDEITSIYLEHPEFALENPEAAMESYPETGTQRILEIRFTYRNRPEELMACQEELAGQVEQLSLIYGSANTDMTNAKRFFNRLGRDTMVVPDVDKDSESMLTNSAYGVLIDNCGTSFGFAQAYALLMRSCGMECKVISGAKDGVEHYWCLVRIDGQAYYVDPSAAVGMQNADFFLMGNEEMAQYGYLVWNASELPVVELPDYMKPIQPAE